MRKSLKVSPAIEFLSHGVEPLPQKKWQKYSHTLRSRVCVCVGESNLPTQKQRKHHKSHVLPNYNYRKWHSLGAIRRWGRGALRVQVKCQKSANLGNILTDTALSRRRAVHHCATLPTDYRKGAMSHSKGTSPEDYPRFGGPSITRDYLNSPTKGNFWPALQGKVQRRKQTYS